MTTGGDPEGRRPAAVRLRQHLGDEVDGMNPLSLASRIRRARRNAGRWPGHPHDAIELLEYERAARTAGFTVTDTPSTRGGDDMGMISMTIDDDTHRQVKQTANEQGVTLKTAIQEALDQWVSRQRDAAGNGHRRA